MENSTEVRRQRAVVAATLVGGTAVLAATLAAPSGSGPFFGLALLAAVVWIVGGRLAGPVTLRRPGARAPGFLEIATPIVAGAILFGAFLGAKLIADQIPLLAGSVNRVLNRADTGPRALVLAVALINGVGEELFFRGALYSAFPRKYAVVATTIIYCLVTVATLNVALVAAALVVGAIFVAERRARGGVLAPLLTHVTWSTLVILLLPR